MICNICPRKCNAIRTGKDNIGGFCSSGALVRIARAGLHYYEEPIISGTNGSGTVFFSGCSLRCVFCQNEQISHGNFGKDISVQRLAEIFRELYESGAHNINLVTPTHYSYAIKQALDIFRPPIPIVYNTSGYELPQIIKSLEDYIDVYLFDFKYISEENAKRYSKAFNYPKYVIPSILEAYRQKNKCLIDGDLIKSGVVVRHLLLPGYTNEAIKIFDFVKDNMPNAYFSIMNQYTPMGEAKNILPLNRTVTKREYEKVLDYIIDGDFENCYFQDIGTSDTRFIPDFDLSGV